VMDFMLLHSGRVGLFMLAMLHIEHLLVPKK
jgi:hypothetical protein